MFEFLQSCFWRNITSQENHALYVDILVVIKLFVTINFVEQSDKKKSVKSSIWAIFGVGQWGIISEALRGRTVVFHSFASFFFFLSIYLTKKSQKGSFWRWVRGVRMSGHSGAPKIAFWKWGGGGALKKTTKPIYRPIAPPNASRKKTLFSFIFFFIVNRILHLHFFGFSIPFCLTNFLFYFI